jgi:CRP/FNR family transcriptional regulator
MTVSAQDLRAIFLFAEFEGSELDLVQEIVTARGYSAGTMIFLQSEPSPGLWFVRHGRVRLYRIAPSGREFTLCIARSGSLPCMGACPLFDGDRCPANAQALDDATVYFIDRQRALEIARDHSGMAHLFARVLANYSRYLMRLSSGLALRCSTPRLIDLLLTYADERGRTTGRVIEFDLDVSRYLLASMLGTTPQMIAQDLLDLKRAGIVDAQGKHILILDRQRLKQML